MQSSPPLRVFHSDSLVDYTVHEKLYYHASMPLFPHTVIWCILYLTSWFPCAILRSVYQSQVFCDMINSSCSCSPRIQFWNELHVTGMMFNMLLLQLHNGTHHMIKSYFKIQRKCGNVQLVVLHVI